MLHRLSDDTSMTGWDPVGADTVTVTPGSLPTAVASFDATPRPPATTPRTAVDDALVACADLLDGRGDPADAMQQLRTWLESYGDDPAPMCALLGGLGVAGFADVLLMLGAIEPADDAVSTAMSSATGCGSSARPTDSAPTPWPGC